MRFSSITISLSALLLLHVLTGTAFCGAFDDAEEWGGYWRASEPHFGRRYEVPPTLYYGHSPIPERIPTGNESRPAPLYRVVPPTSTGEYVEPYQPRFYRRGRYYGPWLDPYFAPGRVSYGGYRYGWW
jgi:hypothetical protein